VPERINDVRFWGVIRTEICALRALPLMTQT
jgi:hypothetical protein